MKRDKLQDLRGKNIEELKTLLREARTELAKLRVESGVKKTKNVRQRFFQRKTIACLLTLIREKEIANV